MIRDKRSKFWCSELVLTDSEQRSVRSRALRHIAVLPSGCWEWTGNKFATGYGSIKQRGRRMLAHRVVYAAFVGAIPESMTLDHRCRHLACVNPDHLEIVTLGLNVSRNMSPSSLNAVKTHCVRGHALVEGNLVSRTGRKHRTCLMCHRVASRDAGRRWRSVPGNLEKHAMKERERRATMKAYKSSGMVRQGDVLLMPSDGDDATRTEVPADPRGLVLAEGESSFHHHAVFGRGNKLFQRAASSDRVLTVARGGAVVRTVGGGALGLDRHIAIPVAPGSRTVRVQRSWTSANASRRVSD